MSRSIVIEELARVEGHGGIQVELDGDAVSAVRFDVFEGPRFLEKLMQGRHYTDVAVTLSRICAICSAAHYVTSLKATEAAFGMRVSRQTEMLRELLFRGENIESHALHVFLLATPDYLGYPGATAMAGKYPEVVRLGLELKQLGNLIQETIGGRAIHPIYPVLGGFAHVPAVAQLVQLRDRLTQVRDKADVVLEFLALLPMAKGCHAETVFAALTPTELGYTHSGDIAFWTDREEHRFRANEYRTFTNEHTVAHSNAKHSLFEDRPFMVGALARLTVNQNKLPPSALYAMAAIGLSLPSRDPLDNTKAQAVELLMDIDWCLGAIEDLLHEGVTAEQPVRIEPCAGTGTAVTEAPRGLLVHSYSYNEDYRIASADVITPTAMNAASIERHFRLSVEQSADKSDAALKRRLEMIARAYDPCISCSVHMVRLHARA